MVQIAVAGALGRMGRTVIETARHDPAITCRLGTYQEGGNSADEDARQMEALHDVILKPLHEITAADPFEVLIDFTTPESTLAHLEQCVVLNRAMVIGTTGLNASALSSIQKASQKIAIVQAPNMSLGIHICYELLKRASTLLQGDWQVAISEIHHQHKKDKPSGTALQMGEVVQQASPAPLNIDYHSIRAGEVLGEHTVLFANGHERLEISHKASSRSIFAVGALQAAKWIKSKKNGLYGLEDVVQSFSHC